MWIIPLIVKFPHAKKPNGLCNELSLILIDYNFIIRHWTKEFQTLLNYNPEDAANFDNGVFWIDYKSLQKYFDVLYLNWSPSLFQNTFVLHQLWRAGAGPAKDIYNIGENPQFSLEVSLTFKVNIKIDF